jgi:hypothetical protein
MSVRDTGAVPGASTTRNMSRWAMESTGLRVCQRPTSSDARPYTRFFQEGRYRFRLPSPRFEPFRIH